MSCHHVTIVAGAFLLVLVLSAGGYVVVKNPETRVLDDAARRSAPGKFVRLTDGVTHYDLAFYADRYLAFLALLFFIGTLLSSFRFTTRAVLAREGPLQSIWRRPGVSTSESLTDS